MQNLYRKGFPVELIGAGCVPPKSCSGCVGVRAFPGQGGSRVLPSHSVLSVIRCERSTMAQSRVSEWKEPGNVCLMFHNVLR